MGAAISGCAASGCEAFLFLDTYHGSGLGAQLDRLASKSVCPRNKPMSVPSHRLLGKRIMPGHRRFMASVRSISGWSTNGFWIMISSSV